ncbi:MAG: YlmH/Sll1252 family protein [Eubacteriales bacterium]|nr:YlmH/Sll1252 family protein [Eubacteriales bacterium]
MNQIADSAFLRRLLDLAEKADRQNYPTHTGFLTPIEQDQAEGYLKNQKIQYVIEGGYPEAERKICFIVPDGSNRAVAEPETVITALKIKSAIHRQAGGRGIKPLAHRDYLGSLLGIGIRRDQIGDIIVDDNHAVVLIQATILPLLQLELKTVGASTVSLESIAWSEIETKDRGGSIVRITAASMRFDKIAAAGFNVSRSDMTEWIRAGQVQLNWRAEPHPDRMLTIGDVISLRGYGRIRLLAEIGKSRKDRYILDLEKY